MSGLQRASAGQAGPDLARWRDHRVVVADSPVTEATAPDRPTAFLTAPERLDSLG